MSRTEERGAGRRVGFSTNYTLINIVIFAISLAVLLAALKVVKEARRHEPRMMWKYFETVAGPSQAARATAEIREGPSCP